MKSSLETRAPPNSSLIPGHCWLGPVFDGGFNRRITGEEHAPNMIEAGVELEPKFKNGG
jgi:hypothetical protein